MNREERSLLLAESLREAAIKAQEEDDLQRQIARVTADVHARLAHRRIHAAGEDDLICPSCGYKGPEADFEPDDDKSDGYSTDPVTSGTDNEDPDNVGDNPQLPNYDNKVKALKAKYAGRQLKVVDRILINRGFDPFED